MVEGKRLVGGAGVDIKTVFEAGEKVCSAG
jgi:hypothetical protein